MTRSTVQPGVIRLWKVEKTDGGHLLHISASWGVEQITVHDEMGGDRTEWQYKSIRFSVPYGGDPSNASAWLDTQEARLLITAKTLKGATLTTDERASYIDYETGANINAASHPLSPIDEQIGIMRDQIVRILNGDLTPSDDFARFNEIALAAIENGQIEKETLNAENDSTRHS